MSSGIGIEIAGNNSGVLRMLDILDTALNPVALVGFLGVSVEPYLRERAASRFKNEGDDVVGNWAPLKDSTIAFRESNNYGPGPINKRSGELENYIVNGEVALLEEPFGASLTMPGKQASGELADKIMTAQSGRKYPETVPRPVIGMNEADLSFVLIALASHIQGVGVGVLK